MPRIFFELGLLTAFVLCFGPLFTAASTARPNRSQASGRNSISSQAAVRASNIQSLTFAKEVDDTMVSQKVINRSAKSV